MPALNLAAKTLTAALLGLSIGASGFAQSTRSQDLERLKTVPQGSSARTLQVRVRWITDAPTRNPADTRNQFELLSMNRLAVRATAPRGSGVGPDTLVVVCEDAAGRELAWRTIIDPRVVRAEVSGQGSAGGERLLYLQTELLVGLPDLAEAATVRVYKPRGQGNRVLLELLGGFPIRQP